MIWPFTLTALDFAAMSDDDLTNGCGGSMADPDTDRLALTELLWRERERCAVVCDSLYAGICAHRIRELQ